MGGAMVQIALHACRLRCVPVCRVIGDDWQWKVPDQAKGRENRVGLGSSEARVRGTEAIERSVWRRFCVECKLPLRQEGCGWDAGGGWAFPGWQRLRSSDRPGLSGGAGGVPVQRYRRCRRRVFPAACTPPRETVCSASDGGPAISSGTGLSRAFTVALVFCHLGKR